MGVACLFRRVPNANVHRECIEKYPHLCEGGGLGFNGQREGGWGKGGTSPALHAGPLPVNETEGESAVARDSPHSPIPPPLEIR